MAVSGPPQRRSSTPATSAGVGLAHHQGHQAEVLQGLLQEGQLHLQAVLVLVGASRTVDAVPGPGPPDPVQVHRNHPQGRSEALRALAARPRKRTRWEGPSSTTRRMRARPRPRRA